MPIKNKEEQLKFRLMIVWNTFELSKKRKSKNCFIYKQNMNKEKLSIRAKLLKE